MHNEAILVSHFLDQFVPDADKPLTAWPLTTPEDSPDRSITLIYLNGQNHRVNNPSDAEYQIIKGGGYFTIWDGGPPKKTIVAAGDIIRIPGGTPYEDFGANLWMIAICTPRYNPEGVRVLD